MKIYTKTGDEGFTSLYGGKRVTKNHARIEAYGTIDELNSFMGLLRDQPIATNFKEVLLEVQHKLFIIGAIMATPNDKSKKLNYQTLKPEATLYLESKIDSLEEQLQPLTHFILPGGHPVVSYCHVARSVCRRAERLAYELNHFEPLEAEVLKYLNRLSDYLFVLARKLTQNLGIEETKWIPEIKG